MNILFLTLLLYGLWIFEKFSFKYYTYVFGSLTTYNIHMTMIYVLNYVISKISLANIVF